MSRMSDYEVKRAFKYSGNKIKALQKCDFNIPECTRIVEPFMGAATFALTLGKEWLGIDSNIDLILLMEWLKNSCWPGKLRNLYEYQGIRGSIKDLPIGDQAKTYLRVNISGVYVGQLSSWVIYPQHKLPIEDTIDVLPIIKQGTFYCGEAMSYEPREGDLVFIDPPYLDTSPNYKSANKQSYDVVTKEYVGALLDKIGDTNWIFTYGNGAEELFPDIEWHEIYTRKVPNIRGGGVVTRTEHIAFNYPADFTVRPK